MTTAPSFKLREEDVIRLVLEFLANRDLNISQMTVERETGIFNGSYTDDVLFLRQLILDGQWDDALHFVQPLESIGDFDVKTFNYMIVKHKYIELLCIRSEAGPYQNVEVAVDEVVACLCQLEKFCPTKEDYNEFCLLLTLPSISHHPEYKLWNPSNSRTKCFNQILPLVDKYLSLDKKDLAMDTSTARNDRLLQLIIKGILYESCVDYCQKKATSASTTMTDMEFASLLSGSGFSNADLSLLSWLQSIPSDTFLYPFENKTLNVAVDQLEKPSLVASWSEMILVTPIKPKVFPHSATPFTRLKASDLMSKSLTPGLVDGLSRSIINLSVGDVAAMSRSSMAATGFHLSGTPGKQKLMQTSVDKFFEEGDVFNSSCLDILPTISEASPRSPEGQQLAFSPRNVPCNSSLSTNSVPKAKRPVDGIHKALPGNKQLPDKQTPDLWREFQRQRKEVINRPAVGDLANDHVTPPGVAAKANCSKRANQSNDGNCMYTPPMQPNVQKETNYVTPVSQTGQTNYSHMEKLIATSTPKNDSDPAKLRAYQSPIYAAQKSLQFQDTMSVTTTTTASNIFPTISSPQLTRHGPNQSTRSIRSDDSITSTTTTGRKPQFVAVTRVEDAQAIRAAEFHPSGHVYAIGSNSKTLRVCGYPRPHELKTLREDHDAHQPSVLYKRMKHHKGSIYCLGWNASGDLLATGSNDKTVKLMRFNMDTSEVEGPECDLTMHDGTVRDLCFMEDLSNGSSLLISGGAGDCKIYLTDCQTAQPFQALSGHSGHILSLYTWGGAMFVSGSQDRTIRFWDLRSRNCVNLVTAPPASGSGPGSAVGSVCVDPSGRLLVSGHEDANCMLYDIRGGRIIQTFTPHTGEIRTIRFSPKAYYLLSGGYDNRLILTDLQGDLTQPLPSIVAAEHDDKIIQGRWHPTDFTFLTTSADKSAVLWSLPN